MIKEVILRELQGMRERKSNKRAESDCRMEGIKDKSQEGGVGYSGREWVD